MGGILGGGAKSLLPPPLQIFSGDLAPLPPLVTPMYVCELSKQDILVGIVPLILLSVLDHVYSLYRSGSAGTGTTTVTFFHK